MTIWAIVPVKPLRRGKSRLSGILTQAEREDLNRSMLVHTLATLKNVNEIEQVLLVSRDQAALALAREHGARTVQENGAPNLNTALTRATILARQYATRGILIIPADLPLVTADDIRLLLSRGINPPVVVIAPDRHKQGTNGLFVYPAGLIEYIFGPHSFQRHCDRAQLAKARLEICDIPTMALDLDLPEDLEIVKNRLDSFRTQPDGQPWVSM
jgi:2-phospho-L-lactate/phosphoenolpyruvate guanylyltransferase